MAENHLAIGCIVMAAGSAVRFGGDKLAAELEGKTLLRRALEAVPLPCFSRAVAVVRREEDGQLAQGLGFVPVYNRCSDLGISHTIALGIAALGQCDAALFQVADQPLLRQKTVEQLVAAYHTHPEAICALSFQGRRGNPCLFPARFFPELLALSGDSGGSTVIRNHPECLLLVEAAQAEELTDVDTQEGFHRLQREIPLSQQ